MPQEQKIMIMISGTFSTIEKKIFSDRIYVQTKEKNKRFLRSDWNFTMVFFPIVLRNIAIYFFLV